MLSLLFVKDFKMTCGSNNLSHGKIDRDSLILPEIMIDDLNSNIDSLYQSIFDTIWQATGLDRCNHYDNNGNWHGK